MIIDRGRIVAAGGIDELQAASGRRHLEVEVVGLRRRLARRARRPDRPRALERRRVRLAGRPIGRPRRPARAGPPRPARSGRSPSSRRSSRSCSWKRSPRPMAARRRWPDEPLAKHLARRPTGDPRARPQPRVHLRVAVHDRDRDRLVRPDRVPPRRRRPGQGRGRRPAPAGLDDHARGGVERVRQDPRPRPTTRTGTAAEAALTADQVDAVIACPRTSPPRARSSTSRTPTRSSRASSGRAS